MPSPKTPELQNALRTISSKLLQPPVESAQLIRTVPGSRLVSSVFFMLMPDQALVYGDCAINPDPNAQELAEIAIQSADSARFFGVDPRVTMISYSTGSSGSGADVEKVKEATAIAHRLRPDLVIDGPIQYDAATVEGVSPAKRPFVSRLYLYYASKAGPSIGDRIVSTCFITAWVVAFRVMGGRLVPAWRVVLYRAGENQKTQQRPARVVREPPLAFGGGTGLRPKENGQRSAAPRARRHVTR